MGVTKQTFSLSKLLVWYISIGSLRLVGLLFARVYQFPVLASLQCHLA